MVDIEEVWDAWEVFVRSIHECGHAVAYLLQGVKVLRVSIGEGSPFVEPEALPEKPGRDLVERYIVAARAGYEAQMKLYGQLPELHRLYPKIAEAQAAVDHGQIDGWLQDLYPDAAKRREARERLMAKSNALVNLPETWAAVLVVSTALRAAGELSGEKIQALLDAMRDRRGLKPAATPSPSSEGTR
jgi:hypothetical protein